MAVESVTNIDDLDPSLPAGQNDISEGDDHIRNIKKALKNTFPNIAEPMTLSSERLNGLPNFSAGTEEPSGGSPGDWYIQYKE